MESSGILRLTLKIERKEKVSVKNVVSDCSAVALQYNHVL
jgi:hypothetical protein